jgi:hypothetical protein
MRVRGHYQHPTLHSKKDQAMNDKLSRCLVLERVSARRARRNVGCSKQHASRTCTDTTGLATSDVTVRTSLGYCKSYVAKPV